MFKQVFLFFLCFATCLQAESQKYVYEYFSHIESLLKDGEFAAAQSEFLTLPAEVKKVSVFGFEGTVEYLKASTKHRAFLKSCLEHPDNYELLGNGAAILKKEDKEKIFEHNVQKQLPKVLPFSPEFIKYVYDEYYVKNNDMYDQVCVRFAKARELEEQEKALARQKQQEASRKEWELKEREEALARQNQLDVARKEQECKEKEAALGRERQQQAVDAEIATIDKACKQAGYKEFAECDLISMIHYTQREGGLEEFLNTVVGSLKSDPDDALLNEAYSKIKILQVLPNGVLYAGHVYMGHREWFDMMVFIEREKGRLYQEGQSLKNDFYVFTGMYTYVATSGASKSIPAFRKASVSLSSQLLE